MPTVVTTVAEKANEDYIEILRLTLIKYIYQHFPSVLETKRVVLNIGNSYGHFHGYRYGILTGISVGMERACGLKCN